MDGMIRKGTYPSTRLFMDTFEVGERTVWHDIAFMKQRFRAPIAYSHVEDGYYYREKDWRFPPFFLTEGQLLAFLLNAELAERYLGTSFEQPLRDAIQQMSALLSEEVVVSISDLAHHYSIRPGGGAKTPPETLLGLQEAISHHHPIDMIYYTASRGEENQRIVHPYHLLNTRGEWYLVAHDLLRKDIRQFALPRIRTFTVLKTEQFEVDPTFSLEKYLEASFQAEHGEEVVEVILYCDAYQARYMRERMLHSTQEIDDNPDGSIIVRFRTGALAEVQRQILSYGSHVKVLAPMSLITAIAQEAEAITRLYK